MRENLDDLKKQLKELVIKIQSCKKDFNENEVFFINWCLNKKIPLNEDNGINFSMGNIFDLVETCSIILGLHIGKLLHEMRRDPRFKKNLSLKDITKFTNKKTYDCAVKFLELENIKKDSEGVH